VRVPRQGSSLPAGRCPPFAVKRVACGFRNHDNYVLRIAIHAGQKHYPPRRRPIRPTPPLKAEEPEITGVVDRGLGASISSSSTPTNAAPPTTSPSTSKPSNTSDPDEKAVVRTLIESMLLRHEARRFAPAS